MNIECIPVQCCHRSVKSTGGDVDEGYLEYLKEEILKFILFEEGNKLSCYYFAADDALHLNIAKEILKKNQGLVLVGGGFAMFSKKKVEWDSESIRKEYGTDIPKDNPDEILDALFDYFG